jgi:hypothetical protein
MKIFNKSVNKNKKKFSSKQLFFCSILIKMFLRLECSHKIFIYLFKSAIFFNIKIYLISDSEIIQKHINNEITFGKKLFILIETKYKRFQLFIRYDE